jgi:tetratricopeptide (TPR) repeat protein
MRHKRPPIQSILLVASFAAAMAGAAVPKTGAPKLPGFGDVHRTINTRVPAAQAWFDQGIQQAYAFDAAEAVRAFKAALEADPACAICAWGVAWQLGPNYNAARSGDYPEARRYALLAQQLLGGSDTALTRELVAAMATRYGAATGAGAVAVLNAEAQCGTPGQKKIDPLDLAYAQQVGAIADAYPADPDVQSLYAEAALITMPGPAFDTASLQTLPRIRVVIDRIEAGLKLHPRHTGLIHYLTHAADTPANAEKASAIGDTLLQIAPGAPHLLHMPSHLYLRTGRYADMVRVNRHALKVQEGLSASLKQQGYEVLTNWHGHNRTFAWMGAQLQGDSKAAMAFAHEIAGIVADRKDDWGQFARSFPLLTMVHFEQWKAVLDATGAAARTAGLAPHVVAHARALALLRSGRKAGAELATLEKLYAEAAARGPEGKEGAAFTGMLLAQAKAEQALAAGDAKLARAELLKAVAAEPAYGLSELPRVASSAHRHLGHGLLRLRDYQGAEAAFRTDLTHFPRNVWALRGLHRALTGQGKRQEAEQLRAAWPASAAGADPALRPGRQPLFKR